jgi:hypothetical protein
VEVRFTWIRNRILAIGLIIRMRKRLRLLWNPVFSTDKKLQRKPPLSSFSFYPASVQLFSSFYPEKSALQIISSFSAPEKTGLRTTDPMAKGTIIVTGANGGLGSAIA